MEFEGLDERARWMMTGYPVALMLIQAGAVVIETYRRQVMIIGFFLAIVLILIGYFYGKSYFRHYRYHISQTRVVVKKGTVFRRRCVIFRKKVGCVTLSEGPLQRRAGLCTVWFHLPGGVAKLSYVKKEKVEDLLDWNEIG